jgi:Asp-tRNA(Asn)/Glu-tRNA(Gln) amidotransferase C subunit
MQWEELNALVKDFGREKVDEMLDRLNEYSKTHPKKFKEYGCHATVIRVWIRRDKANPQKSTSKFQENLDYANTIIQLFPEQVQKEEIILKELSLVFTYGTVYKEFEFKDVDFKTKVINRLKSMGLHV